MRTAREHAIEQIVRRLKMIHAARVDRIESHASLAGLSVTRGDEPDFEAKAAGLLDAQIVNAAATVLIDKLNDQFSAMQNGELI